MIIMGIDPGVATTGFGVIRKVKKHVQCLDYGIIQTSPGQSPEQRLRKLYLELNKLLQKHKPKILIVESIFFFKNLKTVIPVSQAKGVILLTAAQKRIRAEEVSPLQVKMKICGYGRADKKDVQQKIKKALGLKEIPKPDDAADALAVAVCYALKKA